MERTKIVIMGAAGRDFHNFQMVYRDDPSVEVVAFTAAQIPGIGGRMFPASLSGPLYPEGIPIVAEAELTGIIKKRGVRKVVFAYSDVSHVDVMHKASEVLAAGADFELLGPNSTMLTSSKPVISICAVRTGVGKSSISRYVWEQLSKAGVRAVHIRHPMPYRDLEAMRVERYTSLEDLDAAGCTLEEREEFEHLVEAGAVVYAGVDYEAILRSAEAEADVIIWDGGNNDMPFIRPDLEIVAVDPHRAGHERLYHPGEANFLRADVLVITKVDTARPEDVERIRKEAAAANPLATVVETSSEIDVCGIAGGLAGKRALAIEDGPTVTHGGMAYGAAAIAAERAGANLADPRPYASGSLIQTFAAWPHLTSVLPAMGYSPQQLADLEATIAAVPCDLVLVATPIDLARLISIRQPVMQVTYAVKNHGGPGLDRVIAEFLHRIGR